MRHSPSVPGAPPSLAREFAWGLARTAAFVAAVCLLSAAVGRFV